MMGMGEPLANFDNVGRGDATDARRQRLRPVAPARDAVDLGHGAGASTACARRARWRSPYRCTRRTTRCATSWCRSTASIRSRELLAACVRYLEKAPRDFVTFEYVMLDGVNDAPQHARELVELRARRAVQDQPDSVQSVSRTRVSAPARAAAIVAFRDILMRRRVRRDDPQDARRRHRCRVRPARGPGAGPDASVARIKVHAVRRRTDHAHAPACHHRWSPLVVSRRLQQRREEANPTRRRHRSARHTAAPADAARGARPPAHRSCCGLLRARPDGRCARRTEPRGQARSELCPGVQRLRADLCRARGGPQGGAEFRARAWRLAPNDSDIHHNWGWYLCQHKREREALEQFEIAVRNPLYKTPEIALVNAGRCAITIGDMRAADGYFRGRWWSSPATNSPATAWRSSPTRRRGTRMRARG